MVARVLLSGLIAAAILIAFGMALNAVNPEPGPDRPALDYLVPPPPAEAARQRRKPTCKADYPLSRGDAACRTRVAMWRRCRKADQSVRTQTSLGVKLHWKVAACGYHGLSRGTAAKACRLRLRQKPAGGVGPVTPRQYVCGGRFSFTYFGEGTLPMSPGVACWRPAMQYAVDPPYIIYQFAVRWTTYTRVVRPRNGPPTLRTHVGFPYSCKATIPS